MPVSGWVRPEVWSSHYKWPGKLLCSSCEGHRTEIQMHRNPKAATKTYEARTLQQQKQRKQIPTKMFVLV